LTNRGGAVATIKQYVAGFLAAALMAAVMVGAAMWAVGTYLERLAG